MARDAQKDPKGFYQLYRAKAKEGMGPLKGMDGSLIEKRERERERSKYLEWPCSVLSQRSLT